MLETQINSVLQALAGSTTLRTYLASRARYAQVSGELLGGLHEDQFISLALSRILNGLNERPIYRKTMSAKPFVAVLERKYGSKISRQQQDAHEFLQVVGEKLEEEYEAGKKWAERRKELAALASVEDSGIGESVDNSEDQLADNEKPVVVDKPEEEEGELVEKPKEDTDSGNTSPSLSISGSAFYRDELLFPEMPLSGKLSSTLTCLTCKYIPRDSSKNSFLALTLTVPQTPSTTLSRCLDSLLTTEYIDDYTCPSCVLQHTISKLPEDSPDIPKLQAALAAHPEEPPADIPILRDSAPKRRISRHTQITSYPGLLTIHLQRSIYDPRYSSRKNTCKTSFPERLTLGALLEDKKYYRLVGLVTHKGGHEFGHYECFRRQTTHVLPFSTSAARERFGGLNNDSGSTTEMKSEVAPEAETRIRQDVSRRKKRKGKLDNKWWRISDDKIKECNTKDVLGMEKEAYLLFYERVYDVEESG